MGVASSPIAVTEAVMGGVGETVNQTVNAAKGEGFDVGAIAAAAAAPLQETGNVTKDLYTDENGQV